MARPLHPCKSGPTGIYEVFVQVRADGPDDAIERIREGAPFLHVPPQIPANEVYWLKFWQEPASTFAEQLARLAEPQLDLADVALSYLQQLVAERRRGTAHV